MAVNLADDLSKRAKEAADAELLQIFNATGIDLSSLPPVATAADLAVVLRTTTAALAQDRHRSKGCPFVRIGGPGSRRVRYLRADVARFLAANRDAFA
jgi:hypothetical protein